MANSLNTSLVSSVLSQPRVASLGNLGTNIVWWGEIAASKTPKSTGYDWALVGAGSSVPGQGQIFPQGTYFFFSDMKVYITEIDFGTTPVDSAAFVITDSNVQTTNFVLPFQAGIAATGRQVDENEMDKLGLVAVVGTGQFTLYAEGLDGPVAGKYKIGYQIGVL